MIRGAIAGPLVLLLLATGCVQSGPELAEPPPVHLAEIVGTAYVRGACPERPACYSSATPATLSYEKTNLLAAELRATWPTSAVGELLIDARTGFGAPDDASLGSAAGNGEVTFDLPIDEIRRRSNIDVVAWPTGTGVHPDTTVQLTLMLTYST